MSNKIIMDEEEIDPTNQEIEYNGAESNSGCILQ